MSGGREQIFHSQTGTSIGLKEFQETLEQLQFWDHEEDSTSDERINRILDAAADNPARLRMEVNFLLMIRFSRMELILMKMHQLHGQFVEIMKQRHLF